MDSRYLYNHLTISWYVSISIATKVCQSFEYSSHNIINEHLCVHTIAMIKNNMHFKGRSNNESGQNNFTKWLNTTNKNLSR